MHLAFTHSLIEIFDMLEPEILEVIIPGVHFLDDPLQRLGSTFGISNNRGKEMRYPRISGKLYTFGIDHDQAHLFRGCTHHY